MPHILYHDTHTSREEVFLHQELIQRILSGDAAQIKQLKGMKYHGLPVFRAKINDKHRLVYAYQEHEGKNTLLVLKVMENHDYDELKRMLATHDGAHEAIVEIEPEEAPPILAAEPEPIELHPAFPYKGKTLVFDDSQQEARRVPEPVILMGAPGTGKTSLLYNMMLRHVNPEPEVRAAAAAAASDSSPKALFLSPSAALVDLHKGLYQQDRPDAADAVSFITWLDLLKSYYPEHQAVVTEADFAAWLVNETSCREPSKPIHYELSLIAALGAAKYLSLGQRQCHYSGNKAKQGELLCLWEKWKTHLKANNLLDPMFHMLPVQSAFYARIYVDETQNLPPVALKSLIPLAQEHHFVAALDSDQCLFSSPYIHNCLKELLHQYMGAYSEQLLTQDWRSAPEITEVGNRLLNAKYDLDEDAKRRPQKNIRSALNTHGVVSWIASRCFPELAQNFGALSGTVVIVFQEDERIRAEIQRHLNCYNILTPEQAIGLDFDSVILWNPFSHASGISSLDPKRRQHLSVEQWNALSGFYVAAKRAQQRLFIYDESQARWIKSGLASALLGELPLNLLRIEAINPVKQEEEQANWRQQVEHHLRQGYIRQAQEIMHHHLRMSPQEIEQQIRVLLPAVSAAAASSSAKPAQAKIVAKATAVSPKPLKAAAAAASAATQEFEYFKKFFGRIQSNDISAIKKLLIAPNAEHYLFEVPPRDMGIATHSKSILLWLLTHPSFPIEKTLRALVRDIVNKDKSQAIDIPAFMSLLGRPLPCGTSLLYLCIRDILSDSKLTLLIQKMMKAEDLHVCLDNPSPSGNPVSFIGVEYGSLEILRNLKILGADFNKLSKQAGKMVHVAARKNASVAVFKFLQDAGANLDDISLDVGLAPAHIAAFAGNVSVLRILQELGADLNITPPEHKYAFTCAPIFFAVKQGHLEATRFLLESNACYPLLIPRADCKEFLCMALRNKDLQRIDAFIQKKLQDSPAEAQEIIIHVHDIAELEGHMHIKEMLLRHPIYQQKYLNCAPAILGLFAQAAFVPVDDGSQEAPQYAAQAIERGNS